ncbi:MAG: pyridoxamine 5'-phosphate oxidase, partial [Longimicrobiales bacterium]|nr:pyridoxamine 5'-phosphate oxidase [Longimicrobiales bacterium]
DAAPSSRQVLLKEWGPDQGFVFYTNYDSRKAAELDANPRAALLFHWPTLHRQIRIEGRTERVGQEQSEAYFRTRARGSQIAAWASRQSAELESREVLESRFRDREEEFDGRDVPLPPFWGGYRVSPERIEFWQGRANRMHDRILYRKTPGGDWEVARLSP